MSKFSLRRGTYVFFISFFLKTNDIPLFSEKSDGSKGTTHLVWTKEGKTRRKYFLFIEKRSIFNLKWSFSKTNVLKTIISFLFMPSTKRLVRFTEKRKRSIPNWHLLAIISFENSFKNLKATLKKTSKNAKNKSLNTSIF